MVQKGVAELASVAGTAWSKTEYVNALRQVCTPVGHKPHPSLMPFTWPNPHTAMEASDFVIPGLNHCFAVQLFHFISCDLGRIV